MGCLVVSWSFVLSGIDCLGLGAVDFVLGDIVCLGFGWVLWAPAYSDLGCYNAGLRLMFWVFGGFAVVCGSGWVVSFSPRVRFSGFLGFWVAW